MNWKDLINHVAVKLSRGFSMATKPRKYVQKSALINQFLVYLLYPHMRSCLCYQCYDTRKTNKPRIIFLESYVICKGQKVVVTCIYKKSEWWDLLTATITWLECSCFVCVIQIFRMFYLYFTTTMNITNTLMMIKRIRAICHCLGFGH